MSKIALAGVAAVLACSRPAVHTAGNRLATGATVGIQCGQAAPERRLAVTRGLSAPHDALPAEIDRCRLRQVMWHFDPAGPSPFGYIPTEWTTRPQLLPGTWDVETIFASDDSER